MATASVDKQRVKNLASKAIQENKRLEVRARDMLGKRGGLYPPGTYSRLTSCLLSIIKNGNKLKAMLLLAQCSDDNSIVLTEEDMLLLNDAKEL